jgi:AraC-like DNA-binding protein
MENIQKTNQGNLELIRFKAIELLVILSRAAIFSNADEESLLEANNRSLKRIQEAKTTTELENVLQIAAGRLAGGIFSLKGIRHASALRRAQRYIWENYTRKISLEEISSASGLSAPYFSSIFNEEIGESLSNYLNRIRVEKAASMLIETGKPMGEIADLCGFEDQSWFSKVFKKHTGVNPGIYRKTGNSRPVMWTEKRYKKRELFFKEKALGGQNKYAVLSS